MTIGGGIRTWVNLAAALVCLFASRASADHADALWAEHPNALWDVVHGLCVRDKKLSGRPAPCMYVDRAHGYAVAPDPQRRTQVLLVPTTRITGIESPALLADDAINYWQDAWNARRFFEKRAGRPVPRDRIALAINSVDSRSQNQLHIHIDCVRPDVRAALKAHEGEIGPAWTRLSIPLVGRFYAARRLDGAELAPRNPFLLLARGDPDAGLNMSRFTLVVVGTVFADGSPGFVLLANDDHAAFGEALLDHQCAVLREP